MVPTELIVLGAVVILGLLGVKALAWFPGRFAPRRYVRFTPSRQGARAPLSPVALMGPRPPAAPGPQPEDGRLWVAFEPGDDIRPSIRDLRTVLRDAPAQMLATVALLTTWLLLVLAISTHPARVVVALAGYLAVVVLDGRATRSPTQDGGPEAQQPPELPRGRAGPSQLEPIRRN